MLIAAVDANVYLPAIIAGVVSLSVVFANRWFSKRQDTADVALTEAETEKVKADTARLLIQPLKDSIADLQRSRAVDEQTIRDLTTRVEAVERWAKLLYAQVIEVGVTPFTFEESEKSYAEGRNPR